jgi:dihydrofolate reductase
MRKLFWQVNQTLDGFMEGPDRELDLTAGFADPDFDLYASEMLQSIGGMLLGRVTYQLFEAYWPSATGPDAERMNQLPKFVFSRTLTKVDWSNSRLIQGDVGQEVDRLKRQAGRDLALFGSSDLAATLIRLGLIDEYRIIVSPAVLGSGTPTFKNIGSPAKLRLSKAATWSSGMVALWYEGAGRLSSSVISQRSLISGARSGAAPGIDGAAPGA